jgi:hypothetical protein
MIYPLNPTLPLVRKLAGVIEEAAAQSGKTRPDMEQLRKLLDDPEIKEWRSGITTVKHGGHGRRPRHRSRVHQ